MHAVVGEAAIAKGLETNMRTQVLVVGAGPVGLTAAMDLASRGIGIVVAEIRHAGDPPSVKCNHVSARSMEIFRRLGVAAKLRDAGLPADFPNDCSYRTTATGIELCRIDIPSRARRYSATGGPDTWWPTPEPPHRINQVYLEPILFSHAAAQSRITILARTEITDIEQNDDHVVALARDLDSGSSLRIEASFVIGCDGSRSLVRRSIGANLSGTPVIQRVQSTFIEAPQLKELMGAHKPAWMVLSLNPRRSGTTVAIDGQDRWLIHNHLKPDEPEFDSIDRDWAIRAILGVDERFEYRVLSKEDWVGRRLVADRFRDRRVFICGDAAHLWMPYAGYGMNAGIADAVDLCWQVAAHLNGWAPASDPGCLRGGASAHHRTGVALCHGPCDEDDGAAWWSLRGDRGRHAARPRRARSAGQGGLRSQRAAILLCRIELRLLLRCLADHRL
ncbi:2-polyprenyl-6-methoxyphenol hydroxylase-like FAD-dependent oxidoreductase [Bradyrhizobium sp. GM22.5]